MNMQTLICVGMTMVSLATVIASANQIELKGTHDRVLIVVPENWASYGKVGPTPIAGVSMTWKPAAIDDTVTHSTAVIRADVEPPGSCSLSDKLLKAQSTEFDQRYVSNTERVVVKGKKTSIVHTRNDVADYYYVCVVLREDRILLSLTVSSGKSAKPLKQYKKDFIWTVQHLSSI